MQIHHYESISSTNTVLLEMSKKSAKSWTVVWTSDQTQGKGYAGNVWESEKNKNLAVSLLIKSELNYKELIYFNQWVCVSICEFLKTFCKETYIKWPNDIIITNKKVCGILIETYKSVNELNIVIGIGLNINQVNFENLINADSLANQTGQFYDIEEILSGLLTKLRYLYNLVENKEWKKITEYYNSQLFRKNEVSIFKKEGELFNGIIHSVDESGSIIIKLENGDFNKFKHKEIELIF